MFDVVSRKNRMCVREKEESSLEPTSGDFYKQP